MGDGVWRLFNTFQNLVLCTSSPFALSVKSFSALSPSFVRISALALLGLAVCGKVYDTFSDKENTKKIY